MPRVVSRTATGRGGYTPSGGMGGSVSGPRTSGTAGTGRRRSGALAGPRPAAKPAGGGGGGGGGARVSMPKAQPVAAGPSSAPPEITEMTLKGERDPELQGYMQDYKAHLTDLEEGTTREADVFRGNLDADMERQVDQARKQAAAEGRPFDEEGMRAELKRGQYGAEAEFELGSQRQLTEARQGGLDTIKAPFESMMAEKGMSAETQAMLMDYALGRGGLMSEDKKTAVMQAGQAIDAYKAFLSMLGGGGSFDFSSSYG